MFGELEQINSKPRAFEFYTAEDLWNDEHTSSQMLEYHLNEQVDISSRKGTFIDKSVEWIATHFNVNGQTKIADFGCGPGLYAIRLAGKQADVTGIDFSARSIRYAKDAAKKESLLINYQNQNYLDYKTDICFDLIIMIMCDYCALSPVQRRTMLQKFYKMLKKGGSVLLDVYSLNAFEQRQEIATYGVNLLDGFFSAEKYYAFLNTFKYDDEKVVLDKYTIFEANRTRIIYNWLQHFNVDMLKSEFIEADFEVESLYSDVAGTAFEPEATEFAIVARKVG